MSFCVPEITQETRVRMTNGTCAPEYRSGRKTRPGIAMTRSALAKEVCRYLNENLDRHITIEQLSTVFHVSPTQLKTCFKEEYGVSVYSYSRSQKMRAAARLLRESNCTVLEIAGRYGYSNGSKFAKAFRDVMGMTPKEYRHTARNPISCKNTENS